MALKYLNAEELEKWKANNPGGTYYDPMGTQVRVPSTTKDLGFLGNLARTVSKPFRMGGGVAQEFGYTLADLIRMAQGKSQLERPEKYFGLTEEESQALYEDPLKEGLKSAAGVMSYAVPVGAAKGATGLKAVGQAGLKGAGAGALGGFGLSESGEELKGTLSGGVTGGLFAGALQGIGEVSKGIKAAKIDKSGMSTYLDDIDDVTKVAKLPKKAKSALKRLSESAGFNDPSLSESKNILNYINNRRLAGTTPGQTLENMTQEFARASQLKQEGLEEIGGLSRSYLEQAQKNFDDAIRYKGLSLDKEGTGVYNDIRKTFLTGPQDAKSLDDILMRWNEAGRNAKGAQKMGLSGLYADASKSLRDVLRTTNPGGKYDVALKQLSQILGLDDEGVVAAASSAAEKTGINLPMFQNAGVYGTDIKMPAISNTISKARAGLAEGQLQRAIGSQVAPASQEIPPLLQTLIQGGQRAVPALPGLTQRGGEELATPPTGGEMGRIQAPQSQGINPLNLMLAQEVLSGNISATEANAVLSLLGMGGTGGTSKGASQGQMDAQNAIDMVGRLSSSLSGRQLTGPLKGLMGLNPYATEQQDLQAEIDLARQIIGKFLEGGVLRKEDEEKYRKILPTMYDTQEVAQRKLENLVIELQNRQKQYQQTGYAGYGSSANDESLYNAGY